MKTKPPVFLATFGHPGSGKTYFSERLAKELGYVHISSDRVRLKMFEAPSYNQEEHQAVSRVMDYLAEELLLHGVSVICDANFNKREHRARIAKIAKKVGARYCLVWIKTEENIALKRLQKRSRIKSKKKIEIYRPIDSEIFTQLRDEMERPKSTEAFIEIDGHANFATQLAQLKKQLRNI